MSVRDAHGGADLSGWFLAPEIWMEACVWLPDSEFERIMCGSPERLY